MATVIGMLVLNPMRLPVRLVDVFLFCFWLLPQTPRYAGSYVEIPKKPRTNPPLAPMLDVQGWLDKLYRRGNSKGTTDSAAKGLAAFEHFRVPTLFYAKGRSMYNGRTKTPIGNAHINGLASPLHGFEIEGLHNS